MTDHPPYRVGHGYDIHRTGADRPLILGGVRFDGAPGLAGHSDADVALHAVIDALLGAAALGDIGTHFPPGDPRFRNADSVQLLRTVAGLIAGEGWTVGNIDITIVAERPKIGSRVAEMRAAIATALDIDKAQVSVKGKTNEGLDAVGRGEAISATAEALLWRPPG